MKVGEPFPTLSAGIHHERREAQYATFNTKQSIQHILFVVWNYEYRPTGM
jgi:hypothetical protein